MPSKKQRPKPLAVTASDAAFMLGISRSSIYRLLASGKLAGKKAHLSNTISGYSEATLILVSTIENYLASLPNFVSTQGAGEARKPQARIRAVK